MRRILLLAALLFAQPVHAQVWGWSQTATSNATVDSTINWAEGMPPSAVNDSARAMMARLAEWHADFAGNIVDTGTSSAYAVTTSSGAVTPTPLNNTRIVFRPAHTNVASVTLAADAGTAYPIQAPLGTAVPAGVMLAGVPYAVVFNSGSSAWVLEGYMGHPASLTNSLSNDVSLTSGGTYFTGPSVAQGTVGTWFASGQVTVFTPSSNPEVRCKLWDGTTVISSGAIFSASGATADTVISLSGVLTNPAGNIKISCASVGSGTSVMDYNETGTGKDSTLTAIRIQ